MQVLIAVAVLVVALAVGAVLRRRRIVDRSDSAGLLGARADRPRRLRRGRVRPWLVAVFSSASCTTCADVVRKAKVLQCAEVGVVDVEYSAAAALHRKYHVDAVPIAVIADQAGVVRASFVGPMSATDLWAAVAEVRHPGSSPEPHLGHQT